MSRSCFPHFSRIIFRIEVAKSSIFVKVRLLDISHLFCYIMNQTLKEVPDDQAVA